LFETDGVATVSLVKFGSFSPFGTSGGPGSSACGPIVRSSYLQYREVLEGSGACADRKPPFLAVKSAAHPYKSAIQSRFTMGNT
jgi:hypothetical protein